MEITRIDINTGLFIILFIIIIFIIALIIFFVNSFKSPDDKNNLSNEDNVFLLFVFGLLLSPFIIYLINQNIPTNEYTIYYNKGTLTQTMTTQEIVDVIMSKNVYDELNGSTSTITITLPKENGDNYDAFYEHIMAMEENTSRQKRKQQRQKQEKQQNELKQKYLNETHQVDMKK